MPLYEYECTACKRHTEKIQKFSDPDFTTFPLCGGELKRVISAPAFSLKGGGWYADGYGSAKPAAASEGGNGDKANAAAAPAKDGSATAPAAASSPASSAPAASPAASSSSGSTGDKK